MLNHSSGVDAAATLGRFEGTLKPIATSTGYRLGLVAVAFLMVLLPLIYLGLVAGAGWALWAHLEGNRFLFEHGRWGAYLYIAGAAAGGTLLVFLIKPLFRRREPHPEQIQLRRAEEPVLFGFVDDLCDVVGSPRPKTIAVDHQVNASAGLRRGWLSLFGRDLQLTIGMPLVRTLSLEQLSGVLAHEFGHFAQGAGMRLTFVIRSVNAWFARQVYERDGFDRTLDRVRQSEVHWAVNLFAAIASAFVWLTRKILEGLMKLGHMVSCFMLRQMEFDADSFEARLVGSDVFESTCRELTRVGTAQQVSFRDLQESWREGRLADDLAELVHLRRQRFDAEVLQQLDEQIDSSTTGRFDTHPADTERIAHARTFGATGIFHSERPATDLFADFAATSRQVSFLYYRETLGENIDRKSLHDTHRIVQQVDQSDTEWKTAMKVLGPGWSPFVALDVPATLEAARGPGGATHDPIQAQHEEPRGDQGGSTPEKALERHLEARHQLSDVEQVELLLQLDVPIEAASFGLANTQPSTVSARVSELRRRIENTRDLLSRAAVAQSASLRRALAAVPAETEVAEEAASLLPAAGQLAQSMPEIQEVIHRLEVVHILFLHSEALAEHAKFPTLLDGEVQEIGRRMGALVEGWQSIPAPRIGAAEPERCLAEAIGWDPAWAIEEMDGGLLAQRCHEACAESVRLYCRYLGRLAWLTQRPGKRG